jgi:hypothetical protein
LLKFQKLKKLNPAIRGEPVWPFVFFMRSNFLADMPNILDGDEDWIMQHEKT